MPIEMKLPELGENIEGGDVLRVMVKAGDAIKKDQPVLELETDKATIEVPSSADGVVTEAKVKAGEKVKVGQTIFIVDEGEAAKPAEAKETPAPAAAAPRPSPAPAPEPKRPAQVVEMTRPKPAVADAASIPAAPAAPQAGARAGRQHPGYSGLRPCRPHLDGRRDGVRAAPAAGRWRRGQGGGRPRRFPDFSAWGAVERKPMSGVRRTTAHRLTQAWNTVPHVFQHDRADITAVEALRKRLSKKAEADKRAPITITAFLMKTLAAALKKFPQMNSSVDLSSDEIIYKQYVHIGVAVDTDRGLLVPVIRDVDQKDIFQIAEEIAQAAEKARARKLSLDDMQGGSMTISNLGSLGAGAFTPIVNWPEVAILGVARARMEPVFADGQFVPRFMMPLTLSYDHRVIDGADGARILRWIVEAVEQPALLYISES